MSERMYYIGRKECGCVVSSIMDDHSNLKMTANEVARMIRAGLTIERVTAEVVREQFGDCPHHKVEEQLRLPE